MKKICSIGFIIACMLLIFSCKSVEKMVEDGEYEKAYDLAKTDTEKIRVINLMVEDGEYEKAHHLAKTDTEKTRVIDLMVEENKKSEAKRLLNRAYTTKKEEYLLNKFIDLIEIKKYVNDEYGIIAYDACKRISFSDYNKKWTALNMLHSLYKAPDIKLFIERLVSEKGFVHLTTQCEEEYYKRYEWMKELRNSINSLISRDFQARTRSETEQMQKNAIKNITNVLVKYGQSRYQDDWECGTKNEYWKDDDIGLVDVQIGNTHYCIDYLGTVDKWNYNLPKGYDVSHQMNMYLADREGYGLILSISKEYGNKLGLDALSNETIVYFENINDDFLVKEMLLDLQK